MESDKAGRKGGMERGPAPNMYPVRKPALLGRGVDTGPLASERWWLAGMVKHFTWRTRWSSGRRDLALMTVCPQKPPLEEKEEEGGTAPLVLVARNKMSWSDLERR